MGVVVADIADIPNLSETGLSVARIQEFDLESLRRSELGPFSFEESIPAARRAIDLYNQVPVQFVDELPEQQKTLLRDNANATFILLEEVLAFDPSSVDNPNQVKSQLLINLESLRDPQFQYIHPIISYLATRQHDFGALERQARAAAQAARDEAARLRETLEDAEVEANRILDEVRKTAAEQGVSQQAFHFAAEAKEQSEEAKNWQRYTIGTAFLLGAFAVGSLFIGRAFLVPVNAYDAFQLGLSKVLIFATIAFMLFLCARTLMAHRHNRVVNKHRQNALLTFNALVEATSGEDARDIVLTHASACIFAPQDSGFSKNQPSGPPLIEIMPKLSASSGQAVG